jgi:hypothetical protein
MIAAVATDIVVPSSLDARDASYGRGGCGCICSKCWCSGSCSATGERHEWVGFDLRRLCRFGRLGLRLGGFEARLLALTTDQIELAGQFGVFVVIVAVVVI